ncbi:unnamed protein product [Prunus armeniaca]|uniref:Uncharacterized protein n=1 Tax=Prunus armeniaca TaxID=36596 RepID=A0A6J5UZX3_PRUAR|nr:unnamed protein product [Prunus armeniaca]
MAFSHSNNIEVMRENWFIDGGSILILGLLLKKWRKPNYDGGGPSTLAVSKGDKKIGLDESELAPTKKAKISLSPTHDGSLRLSTRGGFGRRRKVKANSGAYHHEDGGRTRKTTKKDRLYEVVVSPSKELEAVKKYRSKMGLEDSSPLRVVVAGPNQLQWSYDTTVVKLSRVGEPLDSFVSQGTFTFQKSHGGVSNRNEEKSPS